MAVIEIWTAQDLYNVRNDLSGHYVQMADIDLSEHENWEPIGDDYYNSFAGSYDGSNYEISNMTIVVNHSYKGLFGSVSTDGFIKNIKLINVAINYNTDNLTTYASGTGGLIGFAKKVELVNCHAKVTINVNVHDDTLGNSPYGVGGLIGECGQYFSRTDSSIDSCSCDCTWNVIGDYSRIEYCGCFAGQIWSSGTTDKMPITNCHATGNITGNYCLGIFMGMGGNIKFEKCSAIGSIKINGGNAAGFGGEIDNAIFINCFSKVDIESTADYDCNNPDIICGFIGDVYDVSCTNCYSVLTYINNSGLPFYTYKESNPYSQSAFMGAYWSYDGYGNSLTNCYYDSTLSPFTDEMATPKTTSEMKQQSTYIEWDFEEIWGMKASINQGYPYLLNYIEVWTAEDLNNVRNDLSASYIQMADIDLSGYENWTPIGDYTMPFTGSYNGNSFKILNLTINSTEDYLGLFGRCVSFNDEAISFQNIYLENVFINAPVCYYVGSLIGIHHKGKIINCHSSGRIDTLGTAYALGGLIGYVEVGYYDEEISVLEIYKSTSSVDIRVSFEGYGEHKTCDSAGGFIGGCDAFAGFAININSCFSSGSIIHIPDALVRKVGFIQSGGFIGSVFGGDITIEKCFSSGDVNLGWSNGGFCGFVDEATFQNCYCTGNLVSTEGYEEYDGYNDNGGFCGGVGTSVVFINCYTISRLDGLTWDIEGSMAGFCPFSKNDDSYWATITNCFYDYTISQRTDQQSTPKTTAEMKTQSTFIDWDFTDIWGISPSINTGYPYLLWQSPSQPTIVQCTATAFPFITGNNKLIAFRW